MDDILTWFDQNPWLNLVFLALALGSIVVSLILYYRGRKEKRPVYNIRNFSLVRGRLRKLERVRITYDAHEVKNLTLTRFAMWNKGRETINRQDIAPVDPIRLQVPDQSRILEAEIDFVQTEANNFSANLSEDERELYIDFDYFHQNEGIVLTIYHTAKGEDVSLLGTVKGVGRIPRGVIEENDIIFPVLDKTIGSLITPERARKLGRIGKFIIIPIVIGVMIPVVPFESVMRLFRRAPAQYKLEDE